MHSHLGKIKGGLIFAVAFFILLGSIIYFKNDSGLKTENNKLQIVASFYPLADFAKNIGGNYVEVSNITPAGAEPHDYEPTPKDIADIYNAKLFLFNGNGLDSWADKIRDDLLNNHVTILKMSEHISSLKDIENGLENDPHFWLNTNNAIKEVDLIADALIKIDPEHKDDYTRNRDDYKARLNKLDTEYKNSLSNCEKNEIITSHNAFNYLSEQYSFDALYILGLSPDAEPSPKAIADLTKTAKEKGIKYIFFETLISPKIAETIANEIGAETLVLNPIEGLTDEELIAGKDYIGAMQDNLINLKLAMQCQ